MALIRAIDAVDVYLREAVRKPALIQSGDFRRELDAAGLSIFNKMQVVERHCKGLDELPLAIVFLMIAWRNRGAHVESDRDAPKHHLEVLKNSKSLSDRFRGLDAEMLLGGYDAMRPVTFKEVASLINAAHHLVAELDSRLLTSLNVERFLKDVIWASLSETRKTDELIDQARLRRAISIWGKDPRDRGDAIVKLLKHKKFSTAASNGTVVPADLLAILQEKTPKSILGWAAEAEGQYPSTSSSSGSQEAIERLNV